MEREVERLSSFRLTHSRGLLFRLLLGLNVHSNLLRLIRDGGKWGEGMDIYVLPPTRYTLTTRMTQQQGGQSCVRHFMNVFH